MYVKKCTFAHRQNGIKINLYFSNKNFIFPFSIKDAPLVFDFQFNTKYRNFSQ